MSICTDGELACLSELEELALLSCFAVLDEELDLLRPSVVAVCEIRTKPNRTPRNKLPRDLIDIFESHQHVAPN